MPTFTRKYLKDNDGNYLATAGLADMQYHSDGETTETKMQTIETTLGNGVLSTVSQNVVEGLNEVADEVIAARTDVNGTYNSLDARLDAMDVKISLASGGGGSIDLTAYQTKEDTSLQTTSKQVVGAINELNDDILVLEDYTGNQGTTNDLTTKVATLSTDVTTLQTEIEDSHTDVNGTVYGTIGQRLDNIEDGYLPLTGGTVSGITTFQDLVKAKCYSIGDDLILNKPFDDSLDVGNSLGTHTVNLCSAQNPKWWTGADRYDLVTAFGATMIRNSSLSWGTSGNIVKILTVDNSDVFRAGDSTINTVIHGKDIYIEPTNGKVYVQGGNVNVRGHAVENASSYGFPNNYMANMQDGIFMCNTTNNADLTIRPNADKTTFTTTGSRFYLQGTIAAGGNVEPNVGGEHWVGTDATPFWGMRCSGGGFTQTSDENLKEDIRTVSDEDYFDMIQATSKDGRAC